MITLDWIKERIKIDPETGYWIWQAGKDKDGYAQTTERVNGKKKRVRIARRVLELTGHPIPAGQCALHNCPGGDNPACCNPEHLWIGTVGENNTDRHNKGRDNPLRGDDSFYRKHPERIVHGSKRGQAKLTEELVAMIRERKKNRTCSVRALQAQLAQELNVSEGTIKKAMWGEKWKHVPL